MQWTKMCPDENLSGHVSKSYLTVSLRRSWPAGSCAGAAASAAAGSRRWAELRLWARRAEEGPGGESWPPQPVPRPIPPRLARRVTWLVENPRLKPVPESAAGSGASLRRPVHDVHAIMLFWRLEKPSQGHSFVPVFPWRMGSLNACASSYCLCYF